MRPIYLGTIFFILGAVGWVLSVVITVITLGKFKILTLIFGVIFIASLPISLLWELALWIIRKRNKNIDVEK